jgi:hypothetical protein
MFVSPKKPPHCCGGFAALSRGGGLHVGVSRLDRLTARRAVGVGDAIALTREVVIAAFVMVGHFRQHRLLLLFCYEAT